METGTDGTEPCILGPYPKIDREAIFFLAAQPLFEIRCDVYFAGKTRRSIALKLCRFG